MNPRLYEKLYGLRIPLIIGIIIIVALCGTAIIGSSLLPIIFSGKSTNVAVVSNTTPINNTTQSAKTETTNSSSPTLESSMVPTPSPTIINTKEPTPTSTQAVIEVSVKPTATATPTPEAVTPTPAPTVTSTTSHYYVCTGFTNGWLHFREQPSLDGRVLGWLPEGKQVVFIQKANTFYPWIFIEVDGVKGYSYGDYLCETK